MVNWYLIQRITGQRMVIVIAVESNANMETQMKTKQTEQPPIEQQPQSNPVPLMNQVAPQQQTPPTPFEQAEPPATPTVEPPASPAYAPPWCTSL